MAEKPLSTSYSQPTEYQFQLNVHIKKRKSKPLFQAFGKSIYEVEWISQDGPSILLVKIDGAKADREASFYVHLSFHRHIVRTFGLVQSNPGSVMLLQEAAPHGDLSDLLQENEFKPTERVLCTIFAQICDAMIFLAHNGIVHGDLACRNILVFQSDPTEPEKNVVKLTDFGLTRASSLYSVVDSPAKTTMTIIPTRYAAPELLRDMSKLNYSEKSDVYSMGVLMWEACSYGALPYSSLYDDNDVIRGKLKDERLPQPSLCSDQLWTVLNECWHLNPQDRPSFGPLMQFVVCASVEVDKGRPRHQSSITNTTSNSYDSSRPIKPSNTVPPITRDPRGYSQEPTNTPSTSVRTKECSRQRKEPPEALVSTAGRRKHELIPCEFCDKLCSKEELLTHEVSCLENPNNRTPRTYSNQRHSTRYKNNKNADDDTVPLIQRDSNRRMKYHRSFTRSDSLRTENFERSETRKKNAKSPRLPCCSCC